MPVTISGTGSITGAGLNKKIAAFTASGTWTVPAGVTYAIAHMIGGGGGIGTGTTASNGSDSSVAFSGGTVTSKGGTKSVTGDGGLSNAQAGQANSGQGAVAGDSSARGMMNPNSAQWIVAGDTVTPAGSITVTVGAGGSAGTNGAAGGSGYVYIEYYE